jgi:hypothetical protein
MMRGDEMGKRRRLLAAVLVAAGLSLACSSTPTGSETVFVTIDYISTVNPTLPFDIGCTRAVIRTHMRASWLDFAMIDPVPVADGHWRMVFSSVPVDTEVQLLVLDVEACQDAASLNGSVTEIVRANGVQLTRVVQLPFAGAANGLAFRVTADGTVIP